MPSKNRGSKAVGFGRLFRWSDSAKKAPGARSVTRVLFLLSIGTLISLIGQSSVAPQANGLYFGTGYNAAVAGNAGGGNQNGVNACATDMVAVGVGLTVNGSSPGFGVYCRAIGPDGQLVAQDQSSAANTTAIGGGSNKVFCPAGQVVTGISFIIWTNVAIRCATPPSLSDNSALIWFTATTSNPASTNCSANGIVAGFFTRTGAWTDAIGAYCLPYSLNTVSYNVNGGSGTAPTSQTQTVPAETFTISSYSGTRTGYHLDGWNTQSDGLGTNYAISASIRPIGAVTLYAKWTSTITYDGNSSDSGSVPAATTAVSSQAKTVLASNSGTLVKAGFTFTGWNTSPNGSGTNYAAGLTTYASAGDITLYAQWNSTITYDGNGQTSASSTVPAATTAKGTATNTTLAAPTTLLKTNFIFDGWNTAANGTGTSYASGLTTYASTGTRTLYAQWKAPITFDGNTNTGGSPPAVVNAITATITLPSNTGSMTKLGYAFSGWNTASNGTGVSYAAGATYTVTGTATLYAIWNPNNTGVTPSFNTDTSSPIGVLGNSSYVINTVYTNNSNDLVLSQYPGKVQIIATASAGTVAITTTTNLTLPKGYQTALNTAAASISFIGNLADVNAALATLKYTAPATAVNATVYVYAAYAGFNGDYRYNPANDHSYFTPLTIEGVSQSFIWADTYAKSRANSDCGVSFNNMCGYLVTITSGAENTFVVGANINNVALWTGMWAGYTNNSTAPYTNNDCQSSCTFKYVPNAPTGEAGTAISYTAWNAGEPNGNNPAYSVIEVNTSGAWNDNRSINTVTSAPGTRWGMFEFGGKGETPTFPALTRTIIFGGIAAPAAPTLDSGSDTGSSSTDKITNDNTPTINIGGLTSGATVTLTATPTSGTAVTCTFVANGTTGSCTFPTLADGTYSIVATQTLGGATTLASTALANVVIDTTPPTVTLSSTVASNSNSTQTSAFTITATFNESVSGLLISEITKDAASSGWTIGATLTSVSTTVYTFTATNSSGTANTPGKLLLRIANGVASDVAGNSNAATTNDFVINTVATVTFALTSLTADSGTAPLPITQTSSGAAVTLPGQGTLLKTGRTFIGWGTSVNAATVLTGSYTPTGPVLLYAQWTPNVYVVTYNANGGNGAPTTASQSYNYGDAAVAPSARGTLTRTGYTFGGWSTTAVASGTIYSNTSDNIAGTTTSYTPTASITLYAKWIANTYAVTFDANNGSGTQMTNLSVTAGTAKALTANSYTRTGYTFGGWNTLANGSGTSYANSASVTLYGDTTIYAQWVPVKPGVPTIAISGSAGNTQITVAVTAATLSTTSGPASTFTVTSSPGAFNCTITSPATTCTFTGLTNGQAYTFTAVATNTTGSSTSSVASSSATPAPYVVTYSLNGGTLATTTANYNLGTPLTLPLPTKSGYTFTGWNNPSNTSVGVDGASYSPNATITLTAQWSANTYTITYNGNGSDSGTVTSAGTFTFGNSYSIAGKGTMAKTGYDFAGWTTAANGSGTLYANGSDSIASSTATYSAAANLSLYAKWTAQVYTITYDVNGATSGTPSKSSDSFTFGGNALTLPTIGSMIRSNYTFGGWSETNNGSAVISPYSPTQTRTLYAVWTGKQYSVSYNGNGNTGGSVPADALYTTGATGITLDNGSSLSRLGYTFSGWKNAAGTTVSGSPYVATDNVTLYAIWSPKTIVVTYDKGIASTNPATFPTTPASGTFGSNFILGNSSDTATVTAGGDFQFAGWKIGDTTYKPGDSYRIVADAPVAVIAQWIQVFEVTYNSNGGAFAGGDGVNDSQCPSKLCTNNQSIQLNSAPTRTGFRFNGWVNQSGATFNAGDTTNVTSTNYIFYASWAADSYTITFAQGAGSNGNASAITDSYGATVQLPASTGYSLAGSKFTGWLIGSTTYPAGALYTLGGDPSPITATAQYTNDTFKIFYNTNGATSGTAVPTTAVTGASITLDAATSFTKDGYDFNGWSDGTNAPYAASYATTMSGTNSTLIAQWKIKAPTAPTFSSVTGADGGVTIIVAAGSSGGTPSSYTVTSSPTGGSCTIYAPATSCSISPLTNGTSYTFSATATNSTGTSSGTTSSAVTPAGKPEAPTGLNAVSGNASATVSLTAVSGSATGGPAISSYTITAYDASNNAVGTPCQTASSATSCVVTGLTNGTTYTFKATASNGLFTSSASAASNAVTPATAPDSPTSVTASSSASGSATVSFSAPTNNGGSAVTSYTVTSSPAGATCSIGANATTYICTGLTDGTSYTYSVIAVNAKGNSASATSSALITQGAASAPTSISATTGDGQATITFSGAAANGSTITGYTVKAYDNTGNEVTGVSCSVTTSNANGSCIVTGLTNGSSYTFKAITNSTANSASVTSSPSIPTAAITPAKAPDAPTGLQVTPGTGKVTVTWTEPSSNGSVITSYTVQAYDAAGNAVSGATCTATAPATTCDVSTNLAAGTNYTFKVTATSAAGTSTPSSASSSAAINAAPSAPLNVVATAANASASISWDVPANSNGSAITGYTVQAYDSNSNPVSGATCTSSASPCTISGITNGAAYTFKVTATNGIGTSTASSASTAVTPSTFPNPPTAISTATGDGQVTVSFTAPTNNGGSAITGYTVIASNGATISGSSSPLTIAGLTNGTSYTFTVKATNKNGDSVASSASSLATPVASSIPTVAIDAQPTGNPYVGSTLTSAITFNGSPTPTQTYQWQVCTSQTDLSTCTNISGATSATYVPTISEEGKYIVVVATATNRVGTATETSNPTLVINPEIIFSAPSPVPGATVGTTYVLSEAAAGGVGTFAYTVASGTLPPGVTLDPATGQVAGTPTTAGTYTFTVRATDSNGVYKDVVITIVVAAASTSSPAPSPTTPVVTPTPTCDADCQAAKDAAAAKAAADKAAADAIAKAAADKAAADAAAAAKKASDVAATNASSKAAADAAAAAAAAKAAVEKAAAAEAAKIAADTAAQAAAAKAKAASDAQAAAAKAAADAAAALKNSTASAAAKAAATASANKAAADAAAAVKAAATAAQQAAQAKTSAANANKQVDIAINSLTSKTAASQASAQANAIAAAAKAAANDAAAAAAQKAAEAKTTAAAAQKAAADTAARIATEQKQAADAAALAKAAADAAAKATAEKVAAVAAATNAAQDLAKVLADKATLAEQAAKATDETARAEIQKKIEEVAAKVEEVQKTVEAASTRADAAVAAQTTAVQTADTATKEAQVQTEEAIAVKAESAAKTAAATKAVAVASVAAKVATAAKVAAAKVPSKAVIATKPSTSTSKNSATATISGLTPGQKVKVTVNVKDK